MFLNLYLSGAAVHFVMDFMLYEAAVRRKSLSRDRAAAASAAKEAELTLNSSIIKTRFMIDFSSTILLANLILSTE